MVLGFKKQFPGLIMKGVKIHTLREDKHRRWHKGRKIQFATGVRTKNYNQFHEGECKSTEHIAIFWFKTLPTVYIGEAVFAFPLKKDLIQTTSNELDLLAKNDGFESTEDFFKWFNKDFHGKIIHWTDFKYGKNNGT